MDQSVNQADAQSAMPSEFETVDTDDGLRFGIARYGDADGVPVLSLHGAPGSRFMFDFGHNAAREKGLQLICPDRAGYGLTTEDRSPTLKSRTERLIKLADRLGLGSFKLMAISGGAPYAVSLAATVPDRIKGMALVSPIGAVGDSEGPDLEGVHFMHRAVFTQLPRLGGLLDVPGQLGAIAFRAAPISTIRMFRASLSKPDREVLSERWVEDNVIRMTKEAIRQGSDGGTMDMAIYAQPWSIDFQKIECASLVWQGLDDAIVPPSLALALADKLPNCEKIALPEHGHFWIYNNIDVVLERLKSL